MPDRLKAVAICWLVMCSAIVGALGYNVDIDSSSFPEGGGGVPSSSFGAAAGQAGHWNGFSGIQANLALIDTTGAWTGVTIDSVGFFSGGGWNNPVNTGDYRSLLNDADDISVDCQYTINGLASG